MRETEQSSTPQVPFGRRAGRQPYGRNRYQEAEKADVTAETTQPEKAAAENTPSETEFVMPKFPDRILEELAGGPKEITQSENGHNTVFESSDDVKSEETPEPSSESETYAFEASPAESENRPEPDDAFARLDRAVLGRPDETADETGGETPSESTLGSESDESASPREAALSEEPALDSERTTPSEETNDSVESVSDETEDPGMWGRHKQKKPSR